MIWVSPGNMMGALLASPSTPPFLTFGSRLLKRKKSGTHGAYFSLSVGERTTMIDMACGAVLPVGRCCSRPRASVVRIGKRRDHPGRSVERDG